MAARQKEMIADEVHQNQILRELYLKELRTQKLYTQYHVNPLRKVHPITRKPMSWHDNLEEPADGLVPAWPPESPPLTILSIQPCLHLPSSEFASLSPSGLKQCLAQSLCTTNVCGEMSGGTRHLCCGL
ncbi:cilia- and flagella-associated protein 144 isoform X3 [Camelus bactrianus]|uniref:Cilia- and flagella-associated protein 144 isoform X3 n=1 Tax=Camelus bactrianus TaxID=9837 RepID=A0AC58RE04_CAMBA